ncbi:MAG: glycosyltransferase [Acidimicrobiales bacterium]
MRLGQVRVRGWSSWDGRPALAVAVYVDGLLGAVTRVGNEARQDVAAALDSPDLVDAGWTTLVELGGPDTATLEVFVWGDDVSAPVALDPIAVEIGDLGPEPGASEPTSSGGFVGSIDAPAEGEWVENGYLLVTGWVLHPDRPIRRVDVLANGRYVGCARLGVEPSPGVGRAHPEGRVARFEHQLDLRGVAGGHAQVKIQIVAQTEDGRPATVLRRTVLVASPIATAVRRDTVDQPSSVESRLAALESAAEGQAASIVDLQEAVAGTVAPSVLVSPPWPPAASPTEEEVLHLQRMIPTVMAWIADGVEVPEELTVSVTIATKGRPELLRRAVDSVLDQSYGRFELVVVDDSDGDETRQLLDGIDDPRLRVIRAGGRSGASAAFNRGLEAVTGDVVAFLDDDNRMHRHWLRSVVWAFTTFPEVAALYGARIKENDESGGRLPSQRLPVLEFAPFDRATYERRNYVDRNAIAFRSSLADIQHDEALEVAVDWDHALRLFHRAPPLALPVIACFYRTELGDRISGLESSDKEVRRIRSRAHGSRPLRVLVNTGSAPGPLEPTIGEDIQRLRDAGVVVTVQAADSMSDAGSALSADTIRAEGIEPPDLVLVHGTVRAGALFRLVERWDVPFACRLLPDHEDGERSAVVASHRLCIGVFDDSRAPGFHEVLKDSLAEWKFRRA